LLGIEEDSPCFSQVESLGGSKNAAKKYFNQPMFVLSELPRGPDMTNAAQDSIR
jgi:hypothetical protein